MNILGSKIKFLNMLGYKCNKVKYQDNIWEISDNYGTTIGKIERKKLFRKNNKKGLPDKYGYIIELDSDTISYNDTKIEDNESNLDSYTFYLKNNDMNDAVEINLGISPSIQIWSNEFGFMSFGIDYRGLHATFKSKTDNFNIEEIIISKNSNTHSTYKEYIYQINYCDKNLSLDSDYNKKRKSRIITATSNYIQEYNNKVALSFQTYCNNTLKYSNDIIVNGTVEEVAIKNGMGIDAINHLRYRLNEMLPFKQDIFELLFEKTPYLDTANAKLFFPDIVEKNISNNKVKQKDINKK